MSSIIAPNGSPLNTAIIGVDSLEQSIEFYRDLIGLSVSDTFHWRGKGFEDIWQLPSGSNAKGCLCELKGCNVGRVLLLEFKAENRKLIRPEGISRAYGLFNLNFYTDDIESDTKKFEAEGYHIWSKPTYYEMSEGQGSPTEVIFDGPDNLAVNLVELTDDDPASKVGQMKIYTQKHGRTHTGLTPVVTSAHTAKNIDLTVEFHRKVLKSDVLIDEVLSTKEQNEFLQLPNDAKTSVKFMQGNHMFGKIALSQPLNYKCHDMVPDAIAPNIGYIAQAFEVSDIEKSENIINDLDCEIYTHRQSTDFPTLGYLDFIMVRAPGSGALELIFQVKN